MGFEKVEPSVIPVGTYSIAAADIGGTFVNYETIPNIFTYNATPLVQNVVYNFDWQQYNTDVILGCVLITFGTNPIAGLMTFTVYDKNNATKAQLISDLTSIPSNFANAVHIILPSIPFLKTDRASVVITAAADNLLFSLKPCIIPHSTPARITI